MSDLLASLKEGREDALLFHAWILMPMDSGKDDMTSSNMGNTLKSALHRTRQMLQSCRKNMSDYGEDGGVVFIGE